MNHGERFDQINKFLDQKANKENLARLDRWVHEVADKIDYDLSA